jgi:polyphosphate kinase
MNEPDPTSIPIGPGRSSGPPARRASDAVRGSAPGSAPGPAPGASAGRPEPHPPSSSPASPASGPRAWPEDEIDEDHGPESAGVHDIPRSVTSFIPPIPDEPPPTPGEFLNRDLSWLEFNARVLHQAEDDRIPLLERVRFLSIFASNLDEFFMKRVGGLRRQIEAGVEFVAYEGISPTDMLAAIRERVMPLARRASNVFRMHLQPALREIGVELLDYDELSVSEVAELDAWYKRNVFPLLTPLAVDPGHRFPFISNLSVSLGIMLRRPGDDEPLFARVKAPEVVEQWKRVGDGHRYVRLIDVMIHNLDELFPGMEILEVLPFRVTRNADVEGDEEDADDLLSQIQHQLRERRFAPVVRLQVRRHASPRILEFLCEEMEIAPEDIYETAGLINYRSLDEIADLPLSEHHFEPWSPVIPPRLRDEEQDVFSVIRQGDLLVHHPYESFDDSVERFIEEAARDEAVLGLKQALYRTSGDSPFVHALIGAAETGKQVAVLVELRARFDEARNIQWARKLEDAGVHVAYGVVGLKTHTKIALVVRREADGLRCYAHIGTGNYHSRTARLYEDVGLLTADADLVADVVELFNSITGRVAAPSYRKLLVAPHHMKLHFLELIDREIEHARAGRPARIVAKMNQLQDRTIIRKLYEASGAGVPVDLIVRGFCVLRPGVPGLSDNIRVISVIGRFLEHSRIYHFGNGSADPLDGHYYIGSADWMYRNLHNRIEAIAPVELRHHRERLWEILRLELEDQRQAWDMDADGVSTLRRPPADLPADHPAVTGTHRALMDAARRRQ